MAEDKLDEAAYKSQAGPITPLDILYGHGAALSAGHYYMAHKCGFTEKSLVKALTDSGFSAIASKQYPVLFGLWALASKAPKTKEAMLEITAKAFPGNKIVSDRKHIENESNLSDNNTNNLTKPRQKGENEMPLITIDNKEYELDLLPTKAKDQLASLQFVDAELQRLNGQIAVFQTARVAYSNALKEALPKTVDMSEVVVGNVK